VVLIAAAGNNGPSAPPAYPASYPEVIAVTATDANDGLFAQANRGPYVAVAAPGVDILVAAPGARYDMTTGTSVAAAHVSGLAALLLEQQPNLTPDALTAVLVRSARDLGVAGRDVHYGAGLVSALDALNALIPKTAEHAAQ
jgi:subtilisin family serine protease